MYIHANTMPFIVFIYYLYMCAHIHVVGVCLPELLHAEAHRLMEGVFLYLSPLYFLRQGLSLGTHWPAILAKRASSRLLLSLPFQHWGDRRVPTCLAFTQGWESELSLWCLYSEQVTHRVISPIMSTFFYLNILLFFSMTFYVRNLHIQGPRCPWWDPEPSLMDMGYHVCFP